MSLTESETHALISAIPSEIGMGFHYDSPNHPVVLKAVETAITDTSIHDALEFGAGHGLVATELAKKGIHVVASDIDSRGLADLAEFAHKSDLDIQTRALNVGEDLPADLEGKFDLVIAKDVFPFILPEAVPSFFTNIALALRKDGKTLITTPYTESRLYREGIDFDNPNGELTKLLTPDAQQFLGTTVSSFNFATVDSLKTSFEDNSLELIEHGLFGRSNGWIWAIAQK